MEAPVVSPPAATSGEPDLGSDELESGQQGEIAATIVVDVGSAVAACLDALDDERVGAEGGGGEGLVR